LAAHVENPTWDISRKTNEITTSGNPEEQYVTLASLCTMISTVCFPELHQQPWLQRGVRAGSGVQQTFTGSFSTLDPMLLIVHLWFHHG